MTTFASLLSDDSSGIIHTTGAPVAPFSIQYANLPPPLEPADMAVSGTASWGTEVRVTSLGVVVTIPAPLPSGEAGAIIVRHEAGAPASPADNTTVSGLSSNLDVPPGTSLELDGDHDYVVILSTGGLSVPEVP